MTSRLTFADRLAMGSTRETRSGTPERLSSAPA